MPGLLDTVKFKGLSPLDQRDAKTLKTVGFKHQTNIHVFDDVAGEETVVREMYHNEKTGLRVLATEFDVKIEGSVPRILGLDNSQQETMTEGDVRVSFENMTSSLLPYTSESIKDSWGLTRIDLARNFKGDIPLVIGAYAQLRHPEIRSATKTMFQQSVMYYGRSREVIIYDKGVESGMRPGELGRAEARWMGVKGLEKFFGAFCEKGREFFMEKPQGPYLPYWAKMGDKRRVVYLSLDHGALNAVLRHDLEKLGAPPPIEHFRTATQVALRALMLYPETFGSFLWAMERTTRYRWEKRLKQCRADLANVDVVNLIWCDEQAA